MKKDFWGHPQQILKFTNQKCTYSQRKEYSNKEHFCIHKPRRKKKTVEINSANKFQIADFN